DVAPHGKGIEIDRHPGEQRRSRNRKDALQHQVVAHPQDDQRPDDSGQDNGGNDKMAHTSLSCDCGAGGRRSARGISTRSSPPSRQAPSAIITTTAVMPNEITIAVSTSACGSGSV